MDRFFYKLFGEECISNRDLVHALYFAGKYRSVQYSFDLNEGAYSQVKSQIACQSYFLIGHELGHLKLKEPNSEGIPAGYKQFIRAAIGVTTRKGMKEKNLSISEYALKAVEALYKSDIINGFSDGTFNPYGNCTRAEVCKMIYALYIQTH